jgi:hypothetical protein
MRRAAGSNQSGGASAPPQTPNRMMIRPPSRRTPPNKRSIPFHVILVVMILTLFGMGLMSIYSMLYLTDGMDQPPPNRHLRKISPAEAHKWIQNVQSQFEARYGSYSETLLKDGVEAFGSLDATAQRMVQASQAGRPFVMAFSGYSITVGRGNFFNQSFPFEVQRILSEPMQKILGIPLVVRNGAIGGIPSFPYGFCLEHFLGTDPDVISWDYSMNEGSRDASVLEAFLRQAARQLSKRPMVIVLDRNERRTKLLKDYTKQGLLADAIAVGKKEILKDSAFKMNPLPVGFQEWDQFGAPKNCPGQGAWHPKRQEHAMIGWMIAMHFLKALERAFEIQQTSDPAPLARDPPVPTFPKALTSVADNDPEVTELLYGHEDHDKYFMKELSCRTSFLPATDHSKVLPSIVVSGLAEAELDIMVDRTDVHYQEGWVLDVSKVERDTKRKVDACGGLGYLDMKIALYGIPESGKLRLWLPFEGPSHEDHGHTHEDTHANHWFDDLIICEANEKRSDQACQLDQDMEMMVGGVPVTSIHPLKGAAEYLKRKTCVNVGVPEAAQITKLGDVRGTDGRPLSKEDRKKFGEDDQSIGMVVDITAKPKVTRADGACCLSHIVWEMH